ncbi:MAG: archaetidylserine decarboxylase [Steroidobacteraceae bacterium]
MNQLFILMQYLLPKHLLSRGVHWLTRCESAGVKDGLINAFMNHFKPEMSDAVEPRPNSYASFNAFFTRALRPESRVVAPEAEALVSPVDGAVSEAGRIDGSKLLQAKGHHYTLQTLLSGAAPWASRFTNGQFATIYLAPFNYHRIHMPCDGTLREAWYVPGDLFSVNAVTAQIVPNLFARNERVILVFDGKFSSFTVVLVGALFVGSMTTVWHGEISPGHARRVTQLPLATRDAPLFLAKGAELGRFNMGSTVVLLFEPGDATLQDDIRAGRVVRMGERLGGLRLG